MKKMKNILTGIILALLAAAMLISCGASGKSSSDRYPSDNGYTSGDTSMGSGDLDPDSSSITSERKLIRRINLSIQTKSFESFVSYVNSSIAELGGYVESSRTDGKNIYSNNSRSANIVARIPSDKTDEFINGFPSETSNIVSREENTEDVTLAYVDTESRLGSLRAQRAALEALYEKAESIEEIAYVQKELSAVISEIEAYEARLREYQNLVSYSTITLYINEVEVYTEVEEDKTYGEEISDGFLNSLTNVGKFFRALSIFAIVNIPYILIWLIPAGVALVVLLIMKKKKK